MTRKERLDRLEKVINSLSIIMREAHPSAGFHCNIINGYLYIYGLTDNLLYLYLLLHNSSKDVIMYLEDSEQGNHIRVVSFDD